MKFYRRPGVVRAISFDLDDTLYDNRPVLMRAEQLLLDWLAQHYPRCQHLTLRDWYRLRSAAIRHQPRLAHHVTQSRHTALFNGLQQCGYSAEQAHSGADQALEVVLEARNQIPVPAETHQVLAALSARVPLVALTNGNADVQRIGLGKYFSFAITAEQLWANKPRRDMFHAARERLALPASQILHVGDHLNSDVYGALRSGYQACWINPEQQHCLRQVRRAKVMPHVEIHQLKELLLLV